MNKIFCWGIIGTGGIANAFTRDLEYVANHKISAVLSRSEQTANQFLTNNNLSDCKVHSDISLFMQDPDIDAVYIATPNTFHCEQAIISLKSKKPVLCEKPIAIDAKETASIIQTSKEI